MDHERLSLPAAILLFVSCATVSLQGCSMKFSVNAKNETDMGSHHVVVKPGAAFTSSSSSKGGNETQYRYTCGDITVTITNEELIVNDKTYGLLKLNDAILIDRGTVYVQNTRVEGKQLSDEEKQERAPVKETRKGLAGYSVAVRPGATMTTVTKLFGRHTLKVGKTTVSIKKDNLSVNDKPYGALETGDTVLIENGKVFVSGSERSPR